MGDKAWLQPIPRDLGLGGGGSDVVRLLSP